MIRRIITFLIYALALALIIGGLDLALWSKVSALPFRWAFAYYVFGFSTVTMWLLLQLQPLKSTDDEGLKGKVQLKGMVGHFVYSLILLVVYWRLLYSQNVVEVWVALISYAASFIIYIRAALKIK